MLCGLPPFYNENLERMYELIELAELKFPKKIPISKDAQDIIIRLLDKNPDTRLGKNGIVEIKFHPFFATIDFDLVYKKSLNAPFKPTVESEQDVRNFDEDYTNEDISAQSLIPQGGLDLIKMNQEKFKDFNKK
jgi:serine/threonine protein kinase